MTRKRRRCCHDFRDESENDSRIVPLRVHSRVSCQHLLALECDFHSGKHRYTARKREAERGEGGREMGGGRELPSVPTSPDVDGHTSEAGEGGGRRRALWTVSEGEEEEEGWTAVFWAALWPGQPFPEPVSTQEVSKNRKTEHKTTKAAPILGPYTPNTNPRHTLLFSAYNLSSLIFYHFLSAHCPWDAFFHYTA